MYVLESADKDGNTINPDYIRCRGTPTPCITYKAGQDNMAVLDIYNNLYTDAVVEFDLTNDLTKFVCIHHKYHTVSSVTNITITTL